MFPLSSLAMATSTHSFSIVQQIRVSYWSRYSGHIGIPLKATFLVSLRSEAAQTIGANFNASTLLPNANDGTKRNAVQNTNVYNKPGQRQLNLTSKGLRFFTISYCVATSKSILFPKQSQNVRANWRRCLLTLWIWWSIVEREGGDNSPNDLPNWNSWKNTVWKMESIIVKRTQRREYCILMSTGGRC